MVILRSQHFTLTQAITITLVNVHAWTIAYSMETDIGLGVGIVDIFTMSMTATHYRFSSLDFVVNRFFMKLFKTNNIDVVNYCRMQFNFELPSIPIAQRSRKFADKYRLCDNALYKSLR